MMCRIMIIEQRVTKKRKKEKECEMTILFPRRPVSFPASRRTLRLFYMFLVLEGGV